ncbi:MAG: ImmA/IrrE family metallo-endopeptidase [Magnetococcales bacterium]|nr:ImmA/IrrE family metallo-endopeptidase [Magnetococcales bacterium]
MCKIIKSVLHVVCQEFRLSLSTIADDAGLSLARVQGIHGGAPCDDREIWALAKTLRLADGSAFAEDAQWYDEPVRMLTRRAEFQQLSQESCLRVYQLSQTARSLEFLRQRQAMGSTWGRFLEARDALQLPSLGMERTPWQQGERLAKALRKALGLRDDPIASMRDLVMDRFPGLTLLYGTLGQDGPEALLFADNSRGVTIALNLDVAKNGLSVVRRFNLAHELCHALVDVGRQRPLAHMTRHLDEAHLEIEQRANAFAVRFLCPPSVLREYLERLKEPRVVAKQLVLDYGLPYTAVRNYLRHTSDCLLPFQPDLPAHLDRWDHAESVPGMENFPVQRVPMEYRTDMARVATELFLYGDATRQQLAHNLGLSEDDPVEDVPRFLLGSGNPAVLFAELRAMLTDGESAVESGWPGERGA